MSLARQHRDRILAEQSASAPAGGGLSTIAEIAATGADRAAAQIQLRLTHDLRRLKEIQSIERKIDAKREMLPEYRNWCDGLLAAGRELDRGVAEEVLPTVMVWSIDVGDWDRALELAEHVLRHDVPLPARYVRSPAALIVEEISEAAIKSQNAGAAFSLDVLERVEVLTADADMHDEIRAKLMKAIGVELQRAADDAAPADFIVAAERALVPLRRAQDLHDRAGAKDRIKRLEKAVEAARKAAA